MAYDFYKHYIQSLTERLQIMEIEWRGRTLQIPQFAVYAVLPRPLFDKIIQHNGKPVPLIEEGRYTIPVVDPFNFPIKSTPDFVVVINHTNGNHFGLFAYPADKIRTHLSIPFDHKQVLQIVQDFV